MRLLDLFCGAGGCSAGYVEAGFEVVGVDVVDQPNYPFEFVKADAMDVLESEWTGGESVHNFDVIHASPPCQGYSKAMKHLAHEQPMLIEPVREYLNRIGKPWVLENVVGAPLPIGADLFGRQGVMICGTGLGLRVYRHRLFESNRPLQGVACAHKEPAMNPHNQAGRDRIYAEFGKQNPDPIWNAAMGVPWMTKDEGREAIPPAYTAWLGRQLIEQLNRVQA